MKGKNKIRDLVRKLSADDREVYAIAGTVKKVTGSTCDVTPLSGDADLTGIDLSADEGSDILVKPSVGSVVMVVMTSDSEGFLAAWSKVDSVVFHSGKNGGVPVTKNVVKKLNTLENRINALEQFAATHTHIVNSPGSPTATARPTIIPQTILPTKDSEIENSKIKH
jgi:hypothetical protein